MSGLSIALALGLAVDPGYADAPALKLRASLIAAAPAEAPLTIELFRWSTEPERAPFIAALAPPPAAAAPAAAAAGQRGPAARGGAAGRGGRGAAPPPSPLARLTTAIKAAPTIGYIWGGGITGYSIKYAWRAAADGSDRIVLVTDRRLGANSTSWPPVTGGPADAEFTVLEMRLDSHGNGDAKASLDTGVVVDAAANTLALDAYAAVPALLKVTP